MPAAGADGSGPAIGPDVPHSFGRDTSWFTVRSDDPRAVARALGLSDLAPANWAGGLAAATPRPGSEATPPVVFISPPVDGWVFVVGSSLPYPDHRGDASESDAETDRRFDHLFTALAVKFSDVQFFANYHAVGFSAWARARDARIERIFSFADGRVLANVGPRSAQERALGFADVTDLAPDGARDRERTRTPQVDDAQDLSGVWSVNPAELERRTSQAGVGYSARLPQEMRQSGIADR